MENKIKLGISSCLLGNQVRFDGGHKHDRFLTGTLGVHVDYVPVCPESECGLGIPREAMRLVGDIEDPRLVTNKTGIDHTRRMKEWAERRLDELAAEDLCGFIFKKDSPSSGLFRVRVYKEKSGAVRKGTGIFAAAFTKRFPLIPVEEEGRLHDPMLRENFIERIFAMKRWRGIKARNKTLGGLVAFHTREKLLILSHSQVLYRRMGKLVAAGKKKPIDTLFTEYESVFLNALSLRTSIKKNVNVLQHLMGYFKKDLSTDEKNELMEILAEYRQEHVPLIVPVTIINHYVRKYNQGYLADQTYLKPHPLDLKLRNHS